MVPDPIRFANVTGRLACHRRIGTISEQTLSPKTYLASQNDPLLFLYLDQKGGELVVE